MTSLTESKPAIQVLNRAGHSINYYDVKGLETGFAFSLKYEDRDTIDGIWPKPGLATATIWDNSDASRIP